jgi:hypothetical protein
MCFRVRSAALRSIQGSPGRRASPPPRQAPPAATYRMTLSGPSPTTAAGGTAEAAASAAGASALAGQRPALSVFRGFKANHAKVMQELRKGARASPAAAGSHPGPPEPPPPPVAGKLGEAGRGLSGAGDADYAAGYEEGHHAGYYPGYEGAVDVDGSSPGAAWGVAVTVTCDLCGPLWSSCGCMEAGDGAVAKPRP